MTPAAFYGVEDDAGHLYAVFATEREACRYLTAHGDDDDGQPFLYVVPMTPDDVAATDAAGCQLPWHCGEGGQA